MIESDSRDVLAALGRLAQAARIARAGRRRRASRPDRGPARPRPRPRRGTAGRESPARPGSRPRSSTSVWARRPSRLAVSSNWRSSAPRSRPLGSRLQAGVARLAPPAPRPRPCAPSRARAAPATAGASAAGPVPVPRARPATGRRRRAAPRPPPRPGSARGRRCPSPAGRRPRARSAGTPSASSASAIRAAGSGSEAHQLAARHHGGQHLADRVGQQDQVHERGRLLQRLEHPVGDLVVHGVDPLEHEHPPGGLERRAGGGGHHRTVHVLGAHHVRAGRADPGQVGVDAVLHPRPDAVGIVAALGQQLGGEGPRRRALAHPGGAVEEVGVRGAGGQRGLQRHPSLRLVLRAGERPAIVPEALTAACASASRAARTAASTSSCTSAGSRSASIRRQRRGSAAASSS